MWSTLADDFSGFAVINRGFGGSRIADATRNVGRLVTPYAPGLVVMYAGDNDIAEGRSVDQVVDDFRAFVARVHSDAARTPVVFVSIKPSVARAALWPQMRVANERISRWAATQRYVIFVDVATKMLDAQGRARPELLLADGLHMQRAGYAIWVDALRPLVERYAGRTPQRWGGRAFAVSASFAVRAPNDVTRAMRIARDDSRRACPPATGLDLRDAHSALTYACARGRALFRVSGRQSKIAIP
jgi:lysophospholipase L1-like esterase